MCEKCEKILSFKANKMYNQLRNVYETIIEDFGELIGEHLDKEKRIEFPASLVADGVLSMAAFQALIMDGYIDFKVVVEKVDGKYETTHFYKPVERDDIEVEVHDIRTAH